jgi:hypothetical protein
MSWIFGITSEIPSEIMRDEPNIHPPALYTNRDETLYIAAGSRSGSIQIPASTRGEWKWIVCGIGIKPDNDDYPAFLSSYQWDTLLQSPEPDLNSIDGHFVAVRWCKQCIEFFTDRCGLRDLYIAKKNGSFVFSTRPDWISQTTGTAEIDFRSFGSRWLCINQLSHRSIFTGMTRICSGGYAHIERGSISFKYRTWSPGEGDNIPFNTIGEKIRKYTVFPLRMRRELLLSLSGGLDSRSLLALLLSEPGPSLRVHTFGDRSHPDAILSGRISRDLKIPFELFDEPIPNQSECLHLLKEFAIYTQCTNAASTALQLRYYPGLAGSGEVIIDGGFGEIWRREFFHRIQRRRGKDIVNKDAASIAPFLALYRSDIFNSDTAREMQNGVEYDVADICADVPDAASVGTENWLDILAIRMRLVNFYGPEQNRVDQYATHFMPYAQPSLLSDLFRLQLRYRRDGFLFRSVIDRYKKELQRYPLVKGGTTYPYPLSTIQSRIWVSVKKKIGRAYRSPTSVALLRLLEEYIRDIVHSISFTTYPHYEHHRIRQMVDAFYKGNEHFADELDWWLGFELMRTGLRNSSQETRS